MLEIHLVLIFMIAAAIIAVEVKDLLSSVVGVGAVGIGLCMAFILLKAPDLAIMQLVVEILSLIILVRGTIRKDLPFSTSGRWAFNTTVSTVFLAVFLIAIYMALKTIPVFGSPEMRVAGTILTEMATRYDGVNIVDSLTVTARSLDTLGEAAALIAVIIGVLAVSRKIARTKES